MSYGIGFASLAATIFHVIAFNGREILQQSKSALKENNININTKLIRKYNQVPEWLFMSILISSIAVAIVACEYYSEQLRFPWWGCLASMFSLNFLQSSHWDNHCNNKPDTVGCTWHMFLGSPCCSTYKVLSVSYYITQPDNTLILEYAVISINPRSNTVSIGVVYLWITSATGYLLRYVGVLLEWKLRFVLTGSAINAQMTAIHSYGVIHSYG